jgi:type VI secretion system protein ImpK
MSSIPATAEAGRRSDNLALAFQEILTVGERLRSNRQMVPDANTFRHSIREALRAAEHEARRRGYNVDDINLAIFAVVAFLDESILNLRSPVFADWPRQPLQEEMFGHHVAGEIFFQNLQKILTRVDSHDTADLLEVYHLCLLLGFAGRYSIGGKGELRAIIDQVADKVRRIRRPSSEISPHGALPNEQVRTAGADPLVRWMMIGAVCSVLLMVLLFGLYKYFLQSGVTTLEEIAARSRV